MVSQATYDQRTGMFRIHAPVDDGGQERVVYETKGYAGKGECKNNPDCEHKRSQGPLPVGRYRVRRILHNRYEEPVFRLLRVDTGPTYGRGGFLIHGDSRKNPGNASSGCIILRYADRVAIDNYDVETLDVVNVPAKPKGRVLDRDEVPTGTDD